VVPLGPWAYLAFPLMETFNFQTLITVELKFLMQRFLTYAVQNGLQRVSKVDKIHIKV